jgi:hypothetical protein
MGCGECNAAPQATALTSRTTATRFAPAACRTSRSRAVADTPAIVVVDDRTRTPKAVIDAKRIVAPIGKFNVHSTVGDL